MKKILLVTALAALFALSFSACTSGERAVGLGTYESTLEPEPNILPVYVPEVEPITEPTAIPSESIFPLSYFDLDDWRNTLHWDDGYVQYGSRSERYHLVLYRISNNGESVEQLAVFQDRWYEQGMADEPGGRPVPEVEQFGIIDDWIIVSVGVREGSGRFFAGDIFRVAKDGSSREALELWSANPWFRIIEGWIYHEHYVIQGHHRGWLRLRPDGTELEYLQPFVYNINRFENGYIYGSVSGEGFVNNLARWQFESDEFTTLFYSNTLPRPQRTETIPVSFSRVIYAVTYVADDYVLFTATVVGWRDDWGMHGWFDYYSADFRVDKDGSNLIKLCYVFFNRIYTMEIAYYNRNAPSGEALEFVYELAAQRELRLSIDARNTRGGWVFVSAWEWDWTSSDPDVIELIYSTTMIPRGVGTAIITATSPDGTYTVSREMVVERSYVEEIIFSRVAWILNWGYSVDAYEEIRVITNMSSFPVQRDIRFFAITSGGNNHLLRNHQNFNVRSENPEIAEISECYNFLIIHSFGETRIIAAFETDERTAYGILPIHKSEIPPVTPMPQPQT